MGWIIKPLCTSRSYCTKFSPNTSSHKTFHGREHRNFASAHRGATTAERSLWWIRRGCYGCSVHWSYHLVNANTVVGSCRRHPRWNPRSESGYSCLITEWSRRQGLTNIGKDANVVFQTSTRPKCENCNRTGHVKAK